MSRARSGAIAGLLALAVVSAGAGAAGADGPVWGKDWAAGQTLPLPFGVGLTGEHLAAYVNLRRTRVDATR